MKKLKLIEPTNQAVSEDVRALISAAYSPNTRRAYQADVNAFLAWGGSVPSRPEEIARYIAENCPRLSVTTMRRRLSALATLHATLELAQNPIRHPLVSKTMRGGAAQDLWDPAAGRRAVADRRPPTYISRTGRQASGTSRQSTALSWLCRRVSTIRIGRAGF